MTQEDEMGRQILDALRLVASDRHKVVLLLGEFGAGKTALMKRLAPEAGATYVNLNLQLTERLLSVPRSQYDDGVTVPRLVDELCDELSPDGRPLFIDNVELLFSPEVGRINPVDTFKKVARQRPILLALPARRHGGAVEYSVLGRKDHMSMPLEECIAIDIAEG
jgi:predicted ribonuclease YlaK